MEHSANANYGLCSLFFDLIMLLPLGREFDVRRGQIMAVVKSYRVKE